MDEFDLAGTAGARLVERARELTSLIAEQAAEAEALRRPTDAVIAALREARIFDLMVPASLGGLGLDLDSFVEVGLALGRGDASIGWVTCFCIEHNWMLCNFPQSFQRELFSDRSHVLAPAVIAPTGRATPVEGGFQLDGRWSWASGAMHADWVIVGGVVGSTGDVPDLRFLALPIGDVVIEDVWHVDGLCGTGSNDVVIDDVFVPEERSMPVLPLSSGEGLGAKLHPEPLYRTPMMAVLGLAAAMPSVAQARAMLGLVGDAMRERVRFGQTSSQAERPEVQMRLARADLDVRRAEDLLRAVAREAMALRQKASVEDRARWVASTALAVHTARGVLGSLADLSGGSAHFRSHPLQRAVRDVWTASAHVLFDLDARLATHGRAMLGLEPGGFI